MIIVVLIILDGRLIAVLFLVLSTFNSAFNSQQKKKIKCIYMKAVFTYWYTRLSQSMSHTSVCKIFPV